MFNGLKSISSSDIWHCCRGSSQLSNLCRTNIIRREERGKGGHRSHLCNEGRKCTCVCEPQKCMGQVEWMVPPHLLRRLRGGERERLITRGCWGGGGGSCFCQPGSRNVMVFFRVAQEEERTRILLYANKKHISLFDKERERERRESPQGNPAFIPHLSPPPLLLLFLLIPLSTLRVVDRRADLICLEEAQAFVFMTFDRERYIDRSVEPCEWDSVARRQDSAKILLDPEWKTSSKLFRCLPLIIFFKSNQVKQHFYRDTIV